MVEMGEEHPPPPNNEAADAENYENTSAVPLQMCSLWPPPFPAQPFPSPTRKKNSHRPMPTRCLTTTVTTA